MLRKLFLPINLLGWYGVVAILLAYVFVNLSLVGVKSIWYLGLNLSGSVAILIEAYSKKDYQPVVLNLVWAGIAVLGLLRLIF